MMRITFGQLRTFEAVARLKSFSGAAEELSVSQPTVSKQIKLLSDELELPLFEQIGKKLYLTEAGRELSATCQQWLNTWGHFEQTIANLKGSKEGRLRIAAVTTTKYFMPRILGPFYQQYPGVEISLELINRDRLLERLRRNEDDLYIMGVPPENMDLEAEPFLDNPLVVLASADHPMAKRHDIPMSALSKEQFICREKGSGTRITVERFFNDQNVPYVVRMEMGSNEAIKQTVAGGLGLAVLSQRTLNPDPAQEDLAILDVTGFPLLRHWYMVRLKGKAMSVVTETFMDFIRNNSHLFSHR